MGKLGKGVGEGSGITWTAAPKATASSGLMFLLAFLPLKKVSNIDWTLGMRVEPPTRTMSCTSSFLMPESLRTCSTGLRVFLNYAAGQHVEGDRGKP